MITRIQFLFLAAATLLLSPPQACAGDVVGGDVFVAGASASINAPSPRDAFVSGFSSSLDGDVAGDGHAAGFDVNVDGNIRGDLYVVGASISVNGSVGEDLTATGFSVRTGADASVGGNARIAAGSIVVSGPVSGSLAATGGTVQLNGAVAGDATLAGAEIKFGENARIGGRLTYHAPSQIDIPASVAPADRVSFVPIENAEGWRDMAEKHAWSFWPSFLSVVSAFVVTLVFLLVVAAVLIGFAPSTVERCRAAALARPGRSLLAGFLVLAMLIGLVPVSAVTIIGIPLIPVVILAIVAAWILAYLLGAYAIALRLATALFAPVRGNAERIAALAAGLVVLAILNFIPVLGWLINLAIMLYGLGAIAIAAMQPARDRTGETGEWPARTA